MFNANSLDEIQWRMEGTELTKDKLVQWMMENKSSIENLKIDKVKQLFPKQIAQITEDNFVNFLINKIKQDEIYYKIFKQN